LRDEDFEGLPYLVGDDNYPCQNYRGASSRAPVGRSEVFPRPAPSLTSSQLPIGSDDEDYLIDLNPQGRGKGPRNMTTDLPLYSEPSLEDINEAQQRGQRGCETAGARICIGFRPS
jgi:hypothetical protein